MQGQKNDLFDLVIIGAAAAGCAAAVYAARRQLNFVVVTKDIGGEVALSGEVENWPGIIHTDGITLAQQFHAHAKSYGVQFDEGLVVERISQEKNIHMVHAVDALGKTKTYRTKAVIIGSGIHPKELRVQGESALKNKGVTYCTVCDGPLYKGKITATIGAGNSALESALMMGGIAKKVYVLTKYPESEGSGFPKGETILMKKLKELNNVEIVYQATTTRILGENAVTGLAYTDASGNTRQLEVAGVMVHIGMVPNSQFVDCGKKNDQKEVMVNLRCETSCPGIFAAGDVTDIPYKQIAIAAGHGVTAALSAIDYINKWEPSV